MLASQRDKRKKVQKVATYLGTTTYTYAMIVKIQYSESLD
jgi:hypothetical protein